MVSWAKELSISELNLLLQYALPMITTDIENSQIMSYALELFPMLILFHPTIWKQLFQRKRGGQA